MRRLLILSSLLLWVPSAFSQNTRYDNIVLSSRGVPLANQTVAVCTQPANVSTTPCSPLATIFSTAAGAAQANPLQTDINGNYHFYAAPGTVLTIQVYGPQIATPFVTTDVTIPLSGSGNNAFTGNTTQKSADGVLYIDPGNPQGWAGADFGGWLASAMTALPANGGTIYVAAGTYSFSTAVSVPSKNVTIVGAGSDRGGAGAPGATVLNWTGGASALFTTPATGSFHYQFKDFSMNNNGTATYGIFLNGSFFVDIINVSTMNPTVKFSSACVGTNGASLSAYLLIKNSNLQNCGTIGVDIDDVNLVVIDQAVVDHNVTNVRAGFTNTVVNLIITNGSDMEMKSTLGGSAIDILLLKVTNAVIENSFFETVLDALAGAEGQLVISAGSNVTNLFVKGNYMTGNNHTNFAMTTNGATNVDIRDNVFNFFLTDVVNNVSCNSCTENNNTLLNGTPGMFNSNTGFGLLPGSNQEILGNSSLAWVATLYRATFLRSGGSVGFPDLVGNGGPLRIGDANGAGIGTVGAPFKWPEGSAPAGAAAEDACYGDSTAHALECSYNNGSFGLVPLTTTINSFTGNTVALTADWTCGTGGTVSTCVAATIIGSGGGVPLTFTLPLFARSYTLECDGVVGQATAVTANNWNLLTATNGATNTTANFTMSTAASAMTSGATTDQASTTTTFNIGPTWTLGAIATKMPFHIWAKIEGASASGTVVSVQLVAPTVADLVTIYRGSACRVF